MPAKPYRYRDQKCWPGGPLCRFYLTHFVVLLLEMSVLLQELSVLVQILRFYSTDLVIKPPRRAWPNTSVGTDQIVVSVFEQKQPLCRFSNIWEGVSKFLTRGEFMLLLHYDPVLFSRRGKLMTFLHCLVYKYLKYHANFSSCYAC